ncbi:hypothetical protein GDO81_009672 [Engystomops pustulosus]|uniref:Uncharacterized protein n=1 Tax=Engystomops pustulosus TaxID=76066 RepID=A0AAV7BTR9_ENGPU|nr:hypothetical protein GDO81_009672 [Engystomops pustulosus]
MPFTQPWLGHHFNPANETYGEKRLLSSCPRRMASYLHILITALDTKHGMSYNHIHCLLSFTIAYFISCIETYQPLSKLACIHLEIIYNNQMQSL